MIDAGSHGLVELDPVEQLMAADGERSSGQLARARLEADVTEVGTIELWCVARDSHGRWKLEHAVRERE